MSHSGSFPGKEPPPSPTRPPETVQTNKQKCSFRDKVLGNQAPVPRRETVDLIGQKLFKIEFENENVMKQTRVVTSEKVVNGVETAVPAVSQMPPSTNMEGNKDDTRINDKDLYGDWLVVNRKKNRKPRSKIQGERAGFTDARKSLGKGLTFTHLANEGKEIEEGGTKFHVMGSTYHPGESAELPKVWTKKNNKRARGMGHKGNEPNKLGNEMLNLGLKDKNGPAASKQQNSKNHTSQGGSRFASPIVISSTTTKPPETMLFSAVRMKDQIGCGGDNHLKPPAPNETTAKESNEDYEDAKEDDDEMVAETPLHNQKSWNHMHDLISRYKPDVIILIETHTLFHSCERFWYREGYEKIEIQEVQGQAGGIWAIQSRGSDFQFAIPCIVNDLPDIWTWNNPSSGIYTAKDAYRWLLEPSPVNNNNGWQWIWRLQLPASIQFFVWQFLHESIPTKDVLHHRQVCISNLCPRCLLDTETIDHCLFLCGDSVDIWNMCGLHSIPSSIQGVDRMTWCKQFGRKHGNIILVTLWMAWCARNNFIFNNQRECTQTSVAKFFSLVNASADAFLLPEVVSPLAGNHRLVTWSRPVEGFVCLNVDGSLLGSSNTAGYGGLLRNRDAVLGTWFP
ncbi:hypothetical protein TSUD_188140 [Trifolium subterraneum]|uniref:Reverse transcriptase zinc-binding domain-containing protein n=1 Tax=Trifolium subterraneum TaxID=3900 RepID=A0A2Z6PRE1_TRISU|nr:hypothetical protein TSUD_188140 [Trifolium subterraneum]